MYVPYLYLGFARLLLLLLLLLHLVTGRTL
jgi:hypothetical protein